MTKPSVVVNKVVEGKGNFGFNAQSGEYGDLVEMGVVDPTKVTRFALQNAASVASLLCDDRSHWWPKCPRMKRAVAAVVVAEWAAWVAWATWTCNSLLFRHWHRAKAQLVGPLSFRVG